MQLSEDFINKAEYLLAHNNYGERINNTIEDLIINQQVNERIKTITKVKQINSCALCLDLPSFTKK